MYRVFLVDDEAIIVEGLKKVVDWNKFGCTVCGSATDGQTGLAAIKELKPDILFSDIRMPEMDGLTMIAALRTEQPQLQISILTGYHDFAYAQQAIRLGVTRLLSKLSSLDEFEEEILAMTKQLDNIHHVDAPPAAGERAAGSCVQMQSLTYIKETSVYRFTSH